VSNKHIEGAVNVRTGSIHHLLDQPRPILSKTGHSSRMRENPRLGAGALIDRALNLPEVE
jgi:hypothetical protein